MYGIWVVVVVKPQRLKSTFFDIFFYFFSQLRLLRGRSVRKKNIKNLEFNLWDIHWIFPKLHFIFWFLPTVLILSLFYINERRILKLTTQLCSLKKRAPPNSVYYRSNSSSRNRQRYRRELQFSFSLKSAQWSVCVCVVLLGYNIPI